MKAFRNTLLALAIGLGATATWGDDAKIVTVYVSDYSYSVDGIRSEDFRSFELKMKQNTALQVSIVACACADVERISALVDWLHELGYGPATLSSLIKDGSGICKECN